MTKKTLSIEIACGETTCASEPGKFCPFVGTAMLGSQSICCLFPSEHRSFTVLEDKDGWLQRCKDCLRYEKERTK